jgi:hypothetical protein
MSFTGKATYTAGANLPELAEDVADLVGIISPYETPLLDALGDPVREASNPHHEWVEDELLPNKDVINDTTIPNPLTDTTFDVAHGSRFRAGDQLQMEGSSELMLVTDVQSDMVTVIRGYAGTTREALVNGKIVSILGNAALEGQERPAPKFTNRSRQGNYTQIFTASVEVSGTNAAASQLGLIDELDYQKQERLRELIRDLENTIINGGRAVVDPQGSSTTRRSLRGIIGHIATHLHRVGESGFPAGSTLDEEKLNYVLRRIWEGSSGKVDLIVVNGVQKRRINGFVSVNRTFGPADVAYRDKIDYYESDFGVCRIVTTRWLPQDAVLLLDSSRVNVLPMAGRSFHFKPLAATGDSECGQLIGEYTLEMKNEAAHAVIRGLAVN